MKKSFSKYLVAIVLGLILLGGFFLYHRLNEDKANLVEDLEKRALIIARSLSPESLKLLKRQLPDSTEEQEEIAERLSGKGRTLGIVLCRTDGETVAHSSRIDSSITCLDDKVRDVLLSKTYQFFWEEKESLTYNELLYPLLDKSGQVMGVLIVVHEGSYIQKRFFEGLLWNSVMLLIVSLAGMGLAYAVSKYLFQKSLDRFAHWVRSDKSWEENPPGEEFFKPVSREFKKMAARLDSARRIAEEISHEIEGKDQWTAARLKAHIISSLGQRPFMVVSNREPYIHTRKQGHRKVLIPPGGLVSALDPVLKACNGLWIAHGSGDADQEVADEEGKLMVPPSQPSYTLKRVWLSKEEEEGYYFGFSNEALWPLCHMTYQRPEFEPKDWETYVQVNHKFAQALLSEVQKVPPLVLVQDYHFTLLPAMVRQERPDIRLGLFWHIPWPHPEAFQICPWHEEILKGMLGANLIGFHFQSYCNRFLETVNQLLPVRVDWDRSAIYHQHGVTYVKPFPIGIQDWNERVSMSPIEVQDSIRRIRKELDLSPELRLVLSVDRLDYTKGILERLRAIDLFFTQNPSYKKKVTFVQLCAPSRIHIPKYRDLVSDIEALTDHVNWKHAESNWKPVIFLKDQHPPEQVHLFMKMSDVLIVSSLADGMNLVAKEFVSARDDEKGVVILSEFAGVSKELEEALIINPYAQEEFAKSILYALEMDEDKQRRCMSRMRKKVQEENVYRWAGNLISDLVRIEQSNKEQASLAKKYPLKLLNPKI